MISALRDTPAKSAAYGVTVGDSAAGKMMNGDPVRRWTRSAASRSYETTSTATLVVALMVMFLVVRHTRAEEESGRAGTLHDQFDVTLEDSDLLGEVELTTNLIIAATESDQPLSTAEIDRILGIAPGLEN